MGYAPLPSYQAGKRTTYAARSAELQRRPVALWWSCPVSTDGLEVLDLLGIFIQIDLTVAVNWQRGLSRR